MQSNALAKGLLLALLLATGCRKGADAHGFKGDVVGVARYEDTVKKYQRDTVDRYGQRRTMPVVEMVGDIKACAIVGEFERPDAKTLTAAGLPIEQLAYGFSGDVLVRIYGSVRGAAAEATLKQGFTEKYGQPARRDDARRLLVWETGTSLLEVNGQDGWATFAISHKQLYIDRNKTAAATAAPPTRTAANDL
jgi:hypothetical protein